MTNVADKQIPNDVELGKFARQQHHLFEMVKKGALPPELGELFQLIVDGKLPNWGGLVDGICELVIAKLLREVGVVAIPATTSTFVAKNRFRLKKDGGICSNLGGNFTDWFLKSGGKTKDPINQKILRYAKLRKSSVDAPIIDELGGKEKAETTLSELFYLMEQQKNGEVGPLLVTDSYNIFYIKDSTGVLRVVFVRWDYDGWDVGAILYDYADSWKKDSRVFSHYHAFGSLEPLARAQVA